MGMTYFSIAYRLYGYCMVKTELIDFQYILDCTLKNKVTDVSNIFIVANFSSLMHGDNVIHIYIYNQGNVSYYKHLFSLIFHFNAVFKNL